MRKLAAAAVLLLLIPLPYASAHPFMVETGPGTGASAPVGTTQVYAVYSESIELDFSSLKVFDSNGDQVDNADTRYHTDEKSLLVTTSPLQDGTYTVSSKVLSRVDGHLVPDAFMFAVGSAELLPEHLDAIDKETVFLPEAAAKFPGLVGQTIILGAVVASLFIWGTQNKQLVREQLEKLNAAYHGRLMRVTGIGLGAVVASDILVLAVQTWRLESTVLDAIQTPFGTTWMARAVLTAALVVVWFWMNKRKRLTGAVQVPMLVLSLALAATTTLVGHGAASGQLPAIALDYLHNIVAAVWIGGIIFFVFVLLPALSGLEEGRREKMSLVLIPRFSMAFVIAVGVVIVTGPTLMWLLESDMGLIAESTYGKLIMAKVSIAAVMVAMGGFFQFRLQKSGEKDAKTKSPTVHRRLRRSLKADVVLGVVLLGVVAILSNGTLPAGEVQRVDAQGQHYGYYATEFSGDVRFDVEMVPFAPGSNTIIVTVSDLNGEPIQDSEDLNVRVSNPQKGISSMGVAMEQTGGGDGPRQFSGEATFGFSGEWQVEIEAPRTENVSEAVVLQLHIKPKLANLAVEVVEYDLPEGAMPLYPLYYERDSIWISDPAAPRIWKFDLDTEEFEPIRYDGKGSSWLASDTAGHIWFTDVQAARIGYVVPETGQVDMVDLPELEPVEYQNIPTAIQPDGDENVWIAITNKDLLLKYDPVGKEFSEVRLPAESRPFALAADGTGRVWFTASRTGTIGYVDPDTHNTREFVPKAPLESPEYLLFDGGGVWVSEHSGNGIARFDVTLETFERIPVHSGEGLPFGMSFGMHGNVWIALHTVDMMAAYDPVDGATLEVPIPTSPSFVQFTTTDGKGNVWIAEQRGGKIAMLKKTILPPVQVGGSAQLLDLKYTDVASPLIAMGILATSLFFVKGVWDKRRLNELVGG